MTSTRASITKFLARFVLVVAWTLQLCAEAGEQSPVQVFVNSLKSVREAKEAIRDSLVAISKDCPSGTCVETNSIEICNWTAAVDIRTNYLITNTGRSTNPAISISKADVELFRLIWSQCKATHAYYWNFERLLHVSYMPTEAADQEISRRLGLGTRK